MTLRHILIILLTALFSVLAQAESVTTTEAGTLHTLVTDHNVTTLSVAGPIDARDFSFINENLKQLVGLNLVNAKIVAYEAPADGSSFAYSHSEKTLPSLALMGMTSLQRITFPYTLVAIDYGALAGCTALRQMSFPAQLESIGNDAFSSCTALTTVTIEGKISHLGRRAFARCSALTSATIAPSVAISIGDEAFMDCAKLSKVTIGTNINSIGDAAFAGCTALKNLSITPGAAVASIGDRAFYGSALQNINFSQMPELQHLGAWSLARTKLKSVTVPSSVKMLDEGVFYYDTELTSLELNKSLSYMPSYMLAGCDKIKNNNVLTAGMVSIGDYALYNHSQHSSLTIPFKVSRIGTRAMAGMTGLKTINAEPVEVPELGNEVWAGVDAGKVTLNVPGESLNLYRNAPQWTDFLVAAPTTRGDINEDGIVNTGDVNDLQRLIATGDATGVNRDLTDVNGDGHVDVGDITSIINIINSTVPGFDPARYDIDNNLYATGSLLSANSATLELSLYNTTPFTAFQFFITAPKGITISQATLSERCPGQQLLLEKTDESTYLLLAYSPANQPIDLQDGIIVTLNVTSSQPITDAQKITATSITFADSQENVYLMPDEQYNLLGTSSIDNVMNDSDNGPVNVYNIQGQLLRSKVSRDTATQGLPEGIYIVGGRKVIVR